MRAGKLRQRVLVQEPIESFDSGQKKIHWKDKGNFWAEVITKNVSEPNQDQTTKAYLIYEVTLRYQTLSSSCRLIWNGKILNLSGPPIEDPRRTSIVCNCLCREGEQVVFEHISLGGIIIGGEHA